jgi:phosphate transport system substrate-binding protein
MVYSGFTVVFNWIKMKNFEIENNKVQQVRQWAARLWAVALWATLAGCGGGGAEQAEEPTNTPTNGILHISVDETFKPIIDSQIKVYQSSFPKVTIVATYKSEAECLKDLEKDSTRMVIVTRGLSKTESDNFKEKLGFAPAWGVIAYDAIAIITHKNARDSMFTIEDIRQILQGNKAYPYKVVMDGKSATSTVRYAIDSLLKGQPLGPNVEAAASSPAVIDYVAKDPNAIGMIGVSWIGNQDDPEQLSFSSKVRIASLACENCEEETYVKPFQANIAMGRYPLIRSLNYILKENYQGTGRGFVNFLIYERGQLIFKRAYLLPGRMQFEVRKMNIKEQ